MPEDVPDKMPEDMPDRMPEDMPHRLAESVPVTKCINVMMGITRSKVIYIILQSNPKKCRKVIHHNLRMEWAVINYH